MDETAVLLEETKIQQDKEDSYIEDEVFFGPVTPKETQRKDYKKFKRRETIYEDQRKRSFEISSNRRMNNSSVPSNVSLCTSIAEENEDEEIDEGERVEGIQIEEQSFDDDSLDVLSKDNSMRDSQSYEEISFHIESCSKKKDKESTLFDSVIEEEPEFIENDNDVIVNNDDHVIENDDKDSIEIDDNVAIDNDDNAVENNNDVIDKDEYNGTGNVNENDDMNDQNDENNDSNACQENSVEDNNHSINTDICNEIQNEIVKNWREEESMVDSSLENNDSVFLTDNGEGDSFTETAASESFQLGHISIQDSNLPVIRISKPSDVESNYQECNANPTDQESVSATVCSVDFDDTAEEKILFEMFGEQYQEEVESLDKEERFKLKTKIYNFTNEEIGVMEQRLKKVFENERRSSIGGGEEEWRINLNRNRFNPRIDSVASTISPFAWSAGSPCYSSDANSDDRQKKRRSSFLDRVRSTLDSDCESISQKLADMTHDSLNETPSDNSNMLEKSVNEIPTLKPCPRISVVPVFSSDIDTTADTDATLEDSNLISEITTEIHENIELTPSKAGYNPNYPSYLQHTYSSIQKCSPQKPYHSPQKPLSAMKSPLKPWNASPKIEKTSPCNKTPNTHIPTYTKTNKEDKENFCMPSAPLDSGTKKKQTFLTGSTPSRIGVITPNRTPLSNNQTSGNKANPVFRTPNTNSAKSKIPGLKSGPAHGVVASPIGQYLKNNPAPPLYRNIKAKLADDLESTLVDAENKCQDFPALPGGSYRSANLIEDVEYDKTEHDYNLHQALGQQQNAVKITRHIDRVRVPKSLADSGAAAGVGATAGVSKIPSRLPMKLMPSGITWNDEDLVASTTIDNCKFNTPSTARDKIPQKSLLKRTQRNSGLFDESMMDQSIHQTDVVVKLNKPKQASRGRGAARGRGKGRGKKN